MPRLSRVIYMLFFIAAVIYVSNRGGAFSYTLFFAALCYPPFALLYLILVKASLRIYQELPVREMKRNMEEPYILTLENAGFLPAAGITLYTYGGRTVFGEDMNGRSAALLPREKLEIVTTLSCRYAGSYPAGISRIVFTDCFGLFRLTLKTPIPLQVQVLPQVIRDRAEETSRLLLTLTMGSSGGRLREQENILGNDLKQYIPGDPVKRIHWKNYARSGELLVRIPEEKELQLISVVLLARPVRYDDEGSEESTVKDIERRGRFLDRAVSVAAYFAEQKRPVQFFFYNAGVKRILGEDYEGLDILGRELSLSLVLRGDSVDSMIIEEAERWGSPVLSLREVVEEEMAEEEQEE